MRLTPRRGAPLNPAGRRRRRIDRTIGIVLGIVVGLAIIAAFVFLSSEGSVDAPGIHGVDAGKPGKASLPATPGPRRDGSR